MSLFRVFRIGQNKTLQVRAEVFNVSNTPHFSNPNANISNVTFNADGIDQGSEWRGRHLLHRSHGPSVRRAGMALRRTVRVLNGISCYYSRVNKPSSTRGKRPRATGIPLSGAGARSDHCGIAGGRRFRDRSAGGRHRAAASAAQEHGAPAARGARVVPPHQEGPGRRVRAGHAADRAGRVRDRPAQAERICRAAPAESCRSDGRRRARHDPERHRAAVDRARRRALEPAIAHAGQACARRFTARRRARRSWHSSPTRPAAISSRGCR